MGLSKEMSLRNEAQLDEVNEKIIKEHKEVAVWICVVVSFGLERKCDV